MRNISEYLHRGVGFTILWFHHFALMREKIWKTFAVDGISMLHASSPLRWNSD